MRFNRSDRRVVLLLFVVILAVWGGVLLDRWFLQPRHEFVSLDEAGMDSLEDGWSGGVDSFSGAEATSSSTSGYYAVPVQKPETFPFDPNSADSTALLRLGLAPWQVRAIYKYRARGGRYHRPEDFKRLPGMTPELWNRLSSSIRIGENYQYYDREALAREARAAFAYSSSSADSTSSSVSSSSPVSSSSSSDPAAESLSSATRSSSSVAASSGSRPSSSVGASDASLSGSRPSTFPRQEKFTELIHLDLNTVDTTTLKKVPGIASYRARQIVRYRDRLGGFSSVEQLSEIENLPVELQAWFVIQTEIYRKLNLNTASIGELARHPYIGSARAKAIADYRRVQGRLHSLQDLSLLSDFSPEVIQRLEPYVEF